MTYAQVSDVQARMVRVPTGLANALQAEHVESFITQIEGEVETILAMRDVTVPVTTPTWFVARLRSIVSDGATAIAYKSVFPESSGIGSSPAYQYWETRYRRGLTALQKGELPSSIVTAGLTIGPSTYFTKNPETPQDFGTLGEGLFDVDKVF